MANLFTRINRWLLAALDLQEHELPNQIDTDLVLPTVDVMQGGWGAGDEVIWTARADTFTGPSAAQNFEPLAASRDIQRLLSFSLIGADLAANVSVWLKIRDPVQLREIRMIQHTLAAGETNRAYWTHIVPGGAPQWIHIPPRFFPRWEISALGGGPPAETLTIAWIVAEFPAGTKVL